MNWQTDIVLMGTGGNGPRIEIINIESGKITKSQPFPKGHSSYAIDIEPDQGAIAVGTKGGLIYIINNDWKDEPDTSISYQRLIQGAPLLSIKWIKKNFLAASDTIGRILLWNTELNQTPETLTVSDGNICSLLNLGDDMLVGISSTGCLYMWDPFEGQLTHTININNPPPISALVKIVYWPEEHALACPGTGGELTLVNPDSGNVRTIYAHESTFYALSTINGNLLTAGMGDGRLKIWAPRTEKPILNLKTQKHVTAAVITAPPSNNAILIETSGKAGIYSIKDKTLRLIRHFKKQDYRMVCCSASVHSRSLFSHKLSEKVKKISLKIQSKTGSANTEEIEALHAQLIELGYKHVSIALRTEQAEKDNNIIQSIRFCQNLIQILPKQDPSICPSLEKYARLLEQVWHITDANKICDHIHNINPDYLFSIQPENISATAEIIKNQPWIIEQDTSIESIIDSATIIGRQFQGRYVLNKLPPTHSNGLKIDVNAIIEKYEQIRTESGNDHLPSASQETVQWISRGGTEQINIMTFDSNAAKSHGLQFAVQIINGDLNTTAIIPIILFDHQCTQTNISIETENTYAIKKLNHIRNNTTSNAYLSAIHNAFIQALRRLLTQYFPKQEDP